jgi:hypothetical protein
MAEILPELRQQNRFQLAHFKSARPFDEEQASFRSLGMMLIAKGLWPHDILANDRLRLKMAVIIYVRT